MRRVILLIGAFMIFLLANVATAQQFMPFTGPPPKTKTFTTTSASSFFSQTMGFRPGMSAMFNKPSMPVALKPNNLVASMPNLQDLLLMRSVLSGPQMTFQVPKQATPKQAPPPPKKK